MKRKLLVAGLASICVVCSAAGLAACAPDAPVAQEGTIYQTEVQTFWVGIGKAYMTFEYAEEPETPEDGAVYGYVFNVNVDAGDGYSSWLKGNWELSEDESTLTLTATWEEGENATYLADATSGQAKTYTAADGEFTIGVILPSAGTINFTLNPQADKVGEGQTPEEPEEPEEPECTEHVDADGDGKCDNCGADMPAETPETPEVQMTLSGTSGSLSAKLELYSDKTWEMTVCYYAGGAYMYLGEGRWTQDTTTWAISLIPERDDAGVFTEESYTLNVDYTTFQYSGSVHVNIPQVGENTFNFSAGEAADEHFTVTYDLNYKDAASAPEAATTSTFAANGKEYVAAAPAVPVRDGYKFAGWYTVPEPVLKNGAADTEYLFGTRLTAFNSAPESITNDVMEITADTTLYARWVQKTEIDSEDDLKNIANDLSGWYVLTADITLTGEWEPLGGYYHTYEFYEPAWWLYAFRGEIDGNGHKITGLKLTTLAHADDSVSATEGAKAGTTGFISSAVNCYVHDITFENAVIDIDYADGQHAYASVVAGFVQGDKTNFENCKVVNPNIEVNISNIWYVSVAGLFGGHWGGYATDCAVEGGSIELTVNMNRSTGKSYEAVYAGALVGEGYAHIINGFASADVSVIYADARTEGFAQTGAQLYIGGAMGSSTYLTAVTYEGVVSLDFIGDGAASVNLGGISGYQRYGYINNCYAKADLSLEKAVSGEGKVLSAGGILGAYDATFGLMGTMFGIDGCRVTSCLANSSLTVADADKELALIGSVPLDAVVAATAPALGVDLSKYTNQDGSYNFFGAFGCVLVRGNAAEADSNGNVTVAGESALYGNAMEEVLGDGWTYEDGKLPVPKAQ